MRQNRSFRLIFRSQHGAALLIMMLLLFIVSMAVLLKGLNGKNTQLQQQAAVTKALAKARESLIAYALVDPDNCHPTTGAGAGHFMCPDTDLPASDPNGLPNTPCGPNAIGRLPKMVTPLSDFDPGNDQQFWYAVSNSYLGKPPSNKVNSSTLGSLTVDGQTDVVAVIIAPGAPLAGQNGRPSQNTSDYLEGGNAGGINFITSYPANPDSFNDKVVAIRRSELMPQITERVAKEIKNYLDAYHVTYGSYPANQGIPFTTALAGAPQWLTTNDWLLITRIVYTQLSANSATLSFYNCGITYTLTFGTATLGRSQNHC
jgi:hypothetical protein